MTNAELIDALNRLDALFSDESVWTKQVSARNAKGREVKPTGKAAVCWCIEGGIYRVNGSMDFETFNPVFEELNATIRKYHGPYVGCCNMWQDRSETTFADIKKLIADTRARLEAA